MGPKSKADALKLNFSLDGRQCDRTGFQGLLGFGIDDIGEALYGNLKALNGLPGSG
jgi:hypothetical protein